MFHKISRILSILVIATMLSVTSTSLAFANDVVGTPGDSPANALAPTQGYVSLNAGQWHWYVIRSQVPVERFEENDAGETVVVNAERAIIEATVRVESGDVDFEVWSADDLNNWVNDSEFTPTGAGTTNESMTGDPLFWQGDFAENNNFYLIVMNRSAGTSLYSLDVTGDVISPSDLTLSSGTPPTQDAPVEVMTEELGLTVDVPAETEVEVTPDVTLGDSPANALAPTQGYVSLNAGQWHWYVIRSQVPVERFEENDDGEMVVVNAERAIIEATVRVESGDVDFEVWSADDLNDWVNEREFTATGEGTTNESLTGDPLFWQGDFSENSNFYLIVMSRSDGTSWYSLDVTGDVISPSDLILTTK